MIPEIKLAGAAILDLLLPRTCVVCGRDLVLAEKHICTTCLSDLPYTRFWLHRDNGMAVKFNALVAADPDSGYEPYSYAAALLYYAEEDGYSHIPQQLKYAANLGEGRFFAKLLGSRLAGGEFFRDVDLVVPVPLHWTRRRSRGYNQAAVVAEELAKALGAPLAPLALSRSRRTSTQTKLSVAEKSGNVAGAFKAKRVPEGTRHILLVDDVFTTGSTLNECRKALRKIVGKEVRISVATLSYTSSA